MYGKEAQEKFDLIYHDSCQKENEYGWRFANLLVVISLGMFAYTSNDSRSTLLYFNWASLCITFLCGFCYLYYIKKDISKKEQRISHYKRKK